MERGVAAVLVGTGALLVAATCWVPVEPRRHDVVLAVIHRPDGSQRVDTVHALAPGVEREWVWRTFPDAKPRSIGESFKDFEARADVGDTHPHWKAHVRPRDAALQLALIAILGGLLAIFVHIRALRRRARIALIPAALPVDAADASAGAGAAGAPARAGNRRVAVWLAGAAVAITGLVIGPCAFTPRTVERWAVAAPLSHYFHHLANSAPPICIVLDGDRPAPVRRGAFQPEFFGEGALRRPFDLEFTRGTTRGQIEAARPRVQELVADRRRRERYLVATVSADGSVPLGCVVAVFDLLQGEANGEIEHFGCLERPIPVAEGALPAAAGTREAALPPRARGAERFVVARAATFDIYVSRDGAIRACPPPPADTAGPVPMTLQELEAALRASPIPGQGLRYVDWSGPAVFIHADTEVPWAYVKRCCAVCARIKIWRVAFVVAPPGE